MRTKGCYLCSLENPQSISKIINAILGYPNNHILCPILYCNITKTNILKKNFNLANFIRIIKKNSFTKVQKEDKTQN